MGSPPAVIDGRIAALIEESRQAGSADEISRAWVCLEDAHVLSQQWPAPHVGVHARMMGLGWQARSTREVVGQFTRLVAAGPASMLGLYPRGNNGRADVSAFEPAPIRPDLADLLAEAETATGDPGVLDADGVRRLYDRVAPFYDWASKPYGWVGAGRLVDRAIRELGLRDGDTVIDLGTGTGRNLPVLADIVGPTGRVIGVDISPQMLARARGRIDDHRLGNVELVETDMAVYRPPADTSAVLSTYAIEMLADYDQVIARLARGIRLGGRIAVTGLRHPDRWPDWITRLGSAVNGPFGVSSDYQSHRPWEAIRAHTTDGVYAEALAGAIYMCAGTTTGTEQ